MLSVLGLVGPVSVSLKELVGLVVRRPSRLREIHGSTLDPHIPVTYKSSTSEATLPGAWRYGVGARTGWTSVSTTEAPGWPGGKVDASIAGDTGVDPRFPRPSHDSKNGVLSGCLARCLALLGQGYDRLSRCQYTVAGREVVTLLSGCPARCLEL